MNDSENIARLKLVADALSDFKEEIVFVGGATVSLYASRPELTTIRATDDIDVVIELISTGEFYRFQEKLLTLGFRHDKTAPIISRYLYRGIKVDFMPADPAILGFSNRWYQEGIRQKMKVALDSEAWVYIFAVPYFLASKFEAFNSRGNRDIFASHDLEDIIYVLDHRSTARKEMQQAPDTVRSYLADQFESLRKHPLFEEALLGHVEQQDSLQRRKKVLEIISGLSGSAKAD